MQRDNLSPTFTDLTVADLGSPRARAFFDKCQAEIPFDRLAASVADVFVEDLPRGGAPHWPVVTLLKIVFLQKCFGLSDPMAEEMLRDRISFRRFVGLSFDDKTPDHSVLSLFRTRLREHGHGATLFEETLDILRRRGLVLSTGTIIDATIIEAPLGSKRADAPGTPGIPGIPGTPGTPGTRGTTADPAASKTVKGGRAYHGFRAHVATDRRGIITDYVFDTASVSEHEHFDHLARNEKKVVLADSGCRSQERVEKLRERGVVAGLCHRRVRGQKELTPIQRRINRLIAPLRAFVEHPFAWIKTRLNHRRARYRGLARNALDFVLSAVACNFCRSWAFKPARPLPG